MKKYIIRPAKTEEWEDAMSLAWRTFQKFEAPIYPQQGIDSFLNFISDSTLYKMFCLGVYRLYLAVDEDGKILGMITVRNENMISLLFVEEKYHRMGIGKQLILYAASVIREEYGHKHCIVNAAPFAVNFYHKLGFYDTEEIMEHDGIYTYPMRKNLL